mmetsp:Transcript_38915/g.93620  ORF Transcript_38915/g.93620 Transcript_38915/m.93620 type:complete len:201 (-) Transcript_38915:623-1225(-)
MRPKMDDCHARRKTNSPSTFFAIPRRRVMLIIKCHCIQFFGWILAKEDFRSSKPLLWKVQINVQRHDRCITMLFQLKVPLRLVGIAIPISFTIILVVIVTAVVSNRKSKVLHIITGTNPIGKQHPAHWTHYLIDHLTFDQSHQGFYRNGTMHIRVYNDTMSIHPVGPTRGYARRGGHVEKVPNARYPRGREQLGGIDAFW